MEILPFEDSIVVLELDGSTIHKAFEAGLSKWPAQEGYGFRLVASITTLTLQKALPRRVRFQSYLGLP